MLRTTSIDRDHLLAHFPKELYLTDHYRDYPWILVRLGGVSKVRLAELLSDAWELVAPAKLRAEIGRAHV